MARLSRQRNYFHAGGQAVTIHPIDRIPNPGGLHPKSEIGDQPISDSRKLAIEWTTSL